MRGTNYEYIFQRWKMSDNEQSLLEPASSDTLLCNSQGLFSGRRKNFPFCRAGPASWSFNLFCRAGPASWSFNFLATVQRTALRRAEPSTSTALNRELFRTYHRTRQGNAGTYPFVCLCQRDLLVNHLDGTRQR